MIESFNIKETICEFNSNEATKLKYENLSDHIPLEIEITN
jgi:hypothetical protein